MQNHDLKETARAALSKVPEVTLLFLGNQDCSHHTG